MPNHFSFRANIDRLWQCANGPQPGYVRLKALDAITRELFAPNDRARLNYQTYLATDPFDVARHKLRDLYDRTGLICPPLPQGEACPALDAGDGGEGPDPSEQDQLEQDDDPL